MIRTMIKPEREAAASRKRNIPGKAAVPLSARTHTVEGRCACGGQCPDCQKKTNVQAGLIKGDVSDRNEREAHRVAAPSTIGEVLRSSGKPLEPATRAVMESHFHRDFTD